MENIKDEDVNKLMGITEASPQKPAWWYPVLDRALPFFAFGVGSDALPAAPLYMPAFTASLVGFVNRLRDPTGNSTRTFSQYSMEPPLPSGLASSSFDDSASSSSAVDQLFTLYRDEKSYVQEAVKLLGVEARLPTVKDAGPLQNHSRIFVIFECRNLVSTTTIDKNGLKCGVDHFLEAQHNGEINEDNLLYIVENMNVAAIETTVWALEWTIAELINYPQIQDKVRAEIRTVLGPEQQVSESDTNKLPYLQAVIKETLRRRMVVPCLLPHMNLHQAKLGGFDIPAQSRVLVNAWWLANNPAHWNKPEEFRPERFLEEESRVEATGNDFKYIPFGVGRRSCPGIVLAMPVLSITLGRLVQNFELLPPPGQSKIDTAENNGQFAARMLNHYTVVMKPIN
uniref:Cinnamate 4-hydroxylase 2 n=1 Tax=Salvia miltiorrhiza TaxID=226208 RepID=U3N6P6_SALMI|nr:cinnamate 4-hydroxylase 2 [Salvia miltiorrhiza]